MTITDTPLFSMLKTRMQWHEARQKVLAENVANADMPGFKPRDLRELAFGKALEAAAAPVSLAVTDPSHIAGGASQASGADQRNARRFETTPSGNAVNLEDEMLKVAQNQSDFQLATSLYQRSVSLLKLAVGKR